MGYVVLHNTSVKRGTALRFEPHLHAWVRNNIFLGGGSPEDRLVRTTGDSTWPGWDYDYNAYGAVAAPVAGELAGVPFDDFATLRRDTMERHAVAAGLADFAAPVRLPDDLFPSQRPPDFALAAGAPQVDAALPIPNVNDRHTGRGPDMGAREFGVPAPGYGPRPPGNASRR